jgi:hypothetical protein
MPMTAFATDEAGHFDVIWWVYEAGSCSLSVENAQNECEIGGTAASDPVFAQFPD